MKPITLTYVLQAASAIIMLATMIVGYMASIQHDQRDVIFNCIICWINFGLFYWQYRVRCNLRKWNR